MSRTATNKIIDLIDEGILEPRTFLMSLLCALSEAEVRENLEHIQRVEDWPSSMRIKEADENL